MASFSQTVQITQFQPSNFFCSMKAECTDEVDTKAVYEELKWQCKENVFQAIRELKDQHNKQHATKNNQNKA